MGYTLRIGELETSVEFDGLWSRIRNSAEGEHHEDAPAYGEPTDHENCRWSSYKGWHNFVEFAGLNDLFCNKEHGLIREHPGCFPLNKSHQEVINKAYQDYYTKYPNTKPGYSPKINEAKGVYEDPDWPIENNHAVRLEWLKYWVDWVIENCQFPVFYNS
jgi:hypothetical protein